MVDIALIRNIWKELATPISLLLFTNVKKSGSHAYANSKIYRFDSRRFVSRGWLFVVYYFIYAIIIIL